MSTLYVDNIYSKTGTSQALTIDSSGNVGVGTTSPSQEMHLYSGTGATDFLIEQGSTGNAYLHTKNSNREYLIGTGGDVLKFYDLTADAERMRINSGGTVHAVNGYSMQYIKTINLTTSYQDIVATNGSLAPQEQGWLLAMSSENGFHQCWLVSTSTSSHRGNYWGGDMGHTHSKDVQWRESGGHIQAKKSLSTGRPLTIFMVAGVLSEDYR